MVGRILQEQVDPAVRPVVGRQVVVEEQLAEHEADADVGERAEREHAVRRLDELPDLRVLALDLLDDAADRLVDEGDPDVVRWCSWSKDGLSLRARQAICAATAIRRTANSRLSTSSGSERASWAPRGRRRPKRGRARARAASGRCRTGCCRQMPATTVGMIASSEVACAWSCAGRARSAWARRGCRRPRRTCRRATPGGEAEQDRERERHEEQPDRDRDEEAANRNESCATGTRCWSDAPTVAPAAAGRPTSSAYAGLDLAVERVRDDAGDRGDADRRERGRRRGVGAPSARRAGAAGRSTMPPPTPKSALKKPATRPISTRRTRLLRGWPWRRTRCSPV